MQLSCSARYARVAAYRDVKQVIWSCVCFATSIASRYCRERMLWSLFSHGKSRFLTLNFPISTLYIASCAIDDTPLARTNPLIDSRGEKSSLKNNDFRYMTVKVFGTCVTSYPPSIKTARELFLSVSTVRLLCWKNYFVTTTCVWITAQLQLENEVSYTCLSSREDIYDI